MPRIGLGARSRTRRSVGVCAATGWTAGPCAAGALSCANNGTGATAAAAGTVVSAGVTASGGGGAALQAPSRAHAARAAAEVTRIMAPNVADQVPDSTYAGPADIVVRVALLAAALYAATFALLSLDAAARVWIMRNGFETQLDVGFLLVYEGMRM